VPRKPTSVFCAKWKWTKMQKEIPTFASEESPEMQRAIASIT